MILRAGWRRELCPSDILARACNRLSLGHETPQSRNRDFSVRPFFVVISLAFSFLWAMPAHAGKQQLQCSPCTLKFRTS